MASSWTLAVDRSDLSRTTLVEHPEPTIADGQALLRIDRVGVTANNVTYAVLGESFRYWEFFPAVGLGPQWGLVPVWGFADVAASSVEGVTVDQRVYGYFPPAAHLVVEPGRVDARGFRDVAAHRAELPSPYNVYASTTTDPSYDAGAEDLLILFRPLFFTSYMLADRLIDNGFYGADVLVLSSASSKTAYAAAFELQGKGPKVVGLTSPGNVAFTAGLGCYDDVLPYDGIEALDASRPTAYLDLSGQPSGRKALQEHFGDRLVYDLAVGLTHKVPNAFAAGAVFFAPDQMRKRAKDWGREELDRRVATAWRRFSVKAADWVDVTVGHGPQALESAWLDVLNGTAAPRTGHVVAL